VAGATDEKTGATAAVREINALLASGSVREASARAPALVRAYPADELLLSAAFDAHMRAGNKQAALATAAQAAKALPGTAVAALHEPTRHLMASRPGDARAACTAALDAFPADLSLSLLKADLCYQAGLLDETLATFGTVLLGHPGDPLVHHLLAQAFDGKGQPQKALAHARLAHQLGLRAFKNLAIIGRGLLAADQPDAAQKALQAALGAKPDDFKALALLSVAEARTSGVVASDAMARKAIAVRPFLRRGPTSAAHLCVVPEIYRPGFFLWRKDVHAYNNANFPSYLSAPDFAFVHAPMTEETSARLAKAGLMPDIVLSNLIVAEALTEDAMSVFAAYIEPLRARGVPVVNGPESVLQTTREANSHRFSSEQGFIFPLTRCIVTAGRAEDDWVAEVESQFVYPILVRPQFTNFAIGLRLVEDADALRQAVSEIGGSAVYAIQYHESRDANGVGRNYRVVVIGSEVSVDRCISHKGFHSHDRVRLTE